MKESKKEAIYWLKKAEEDLKVVNILSERTDANEITTSIGFHCQQAIEKCLKAFLVFHEIDFKKTHDLNKLRDVCAEKDLEFAILEFGNLIDFAVDFRYPDEAYIPELEEILNYKSLATNIKLLLERKIV